MRPDISEELIKRVAEKWQSENKLAVEIPKSKIIEDVLMKYLEQNSVEIKVRDRKRDRLIRRFIKLKQQVSPGIYEKRIKVTSGILGSIKVNKKRYSKDLIISYKGLIQQINLSSPHNISQREFNLILAEDPDIVVIGRGYDNCLKVKPEIIKLADLKNVRIIEQLTPEAARIFNKLYESNNRVVAFMHVTC